MGKIYLKSQLRANIKRRNSYGKKKIYWMRKNIKSWSLWENFAVLCIITCVKMSDHFQMRTCLVIFRQKEVKTIKSKSAWFRPIATLFFFLDFKYFLLISIHLTKHYVSILSWLQNTCMTKSDKHSIIRADTGYCVLSVIFIACNLFNNKDRILFQSFRLCMKLRSYHWHCFLLEKNKIA